MNADSIDNRTLEVLAQVSTSEDKKDDNTTTLSSGVVLRHKKVPPMILAKIEEKYPDPPVPTVYDDERDRYLPNPDSPDYERAVDDNRMKKGNAMIDCIIAMGTQIVSIPDSMQTPDEEDWIEDLEFIGVEVPKLKLGRYLAYIKYYAATSASDIQELAKKGSQALGITEEEVARSIESFQNLEERKTNSNGAVEVSS